MTDLCPIISDDILIRVRKETAITGRSAALLLQEITGLDTRDTMRALAAITHYPFLDTEAILAAEPDFSAIPLSRALPRCCIQVKHEGTDYLLFSNPFDLDLLNWIDARTSANVCVALATEGDIRAVLSHAEGSVRAVESSAKSDDEHIDDGVTVEELSLVAIAESTSPVVRLVNSTLYDALKAGASDIHFETNSSGMEVKYRIDGALDLAASAPGRQAAEQAISRIKVLAELDIAERRQPQDGRFRVSINGRTSDIRVSIMPSIHGEDAVLRILDKRQIVPAGGKLTLEVLGMEGRALKAMRRLAAEPYGMVLVTGPTGSGKTTTLYAAITETHSPKDKVITIEDPVEYELNGVLQIPVNEKKGLTFARGLRSILRHDPDKIMVGEIRDEETAEIAVQSALTGHLVLSTVHANGVLDVFSRFAHMNVDPHSLSSALNGILAQRLLRTVCKNCSVPTVPTQEELDGLGILDWALEGSNLREGRGCGDCRGTGFKGRKAVAEVLVMNDSLRELICSKASIVRIKEEARANGTVFLRQAALELAFKGETTLGEVLRMTMQAT